MFQAWLVKIAKIAAQFRAQGIAGKEPEEERHGEGQKAQDRHRLQDVEQRDQHHLRPPALGRERRVGESEDERGGERGEHAQRRAQRVIGQVPVVERDRRFVRRWQGRGNAVIALGDRGQHRHESRRTRSGPIGSAGARRPAEAMAFNMGGFPLGARRQIDVRGGQTDAENVKHVCRGQGNRKFEPPARIESRTEPCCAHMTV